MNFPRFVLAWSLLLAGGGFAVSAPGAPRNVVADCNEAFTACVAKESPSPVLAVRNMAIFHLAILEAVRQARRAGLDETDQAGAVRAAAYEVGSVCFPTHEESYRKVLRVSHRESLSAARAVRIGLDSARRILESHVEDGISTTIHYVPESAPGKWRRTPPKFRPPEMPQWGRVRPFAIEKIEDFLPPGPPALGSDAYVSAVHEVYRLGGADSVVRTKEQTMIARFWSDFSYTGTPPGHWNEIARDLVRARDLPLERTAELFALMNVAMSDAGIAMWRAKYRHNFWRPVTAIQRANEDGSAQTAADPKWAPLLNTPPHPEYVSGHSGFSGAAAEILGRFFGTDQVAFEVRSETVKGVTRHFTSFRQCVREIAASRVYGGIHYSFSGRDGIELGQKIGARVWDLADRSKPAK